jgi:hypothetical protein
VSSKEGKEENLDRYRKWKLETKDFIKSRLSLNRDAAQAQRTKHQDTKTSINGGIKKEN